MNNSELSIVFDKNIKKKKVPYADKKFKPIKNEKNYYKEFAKEYITIWNILLVLSVLTFNRYIEYLWIKAAIALVLITVKRNGYKSWISYTLTSILMWKFFVTVDGSVHRLVYATLFVFSYVIITILIMALLEIGDLYQEFLLNIIRRKIMDRFPLSKEKLQLCGVHDRLDCLLYYQYMMHGFGRFKNPVICFADNKDENIENLRNVFYEFPVTSETKRKIEEAAKNEILPKEFADVILNRKQYAFYSSSSPWIDFKKLLSESKALYDNERGSGIYM